MSSARVVTAEVDCPVHRSFRVEQVAGMFDVPLEEKSQQRFSVEVPDDDEDWTIGAIVGPSGSGKTTIARQAYGKALFTGAKWPRDKAVVDGFGKCSIKEVTATLTAVGFSSPPAWVKPYQVLSNGEQFRCNRARAMLSGQPVIAYDEFTSVVDRNVAKIGSAAVSKAIRKGNLKKRFVAVTCHYDILEWLEPDWVVDMATCSLVRGRLRRPEIRLEIVGCKREAWGMFAKHHYLSASMAAASRCYLAMWDGTPVAFGSLCASFGHKGWLRIGRLVVLPDYQGVGIGGAILDAVAEVGKALGRRIGLTTSHPAMRTRCTGSNLWRLLAVQPQGSPRQTHRNQNGQKVRNAHGRAICRFEYIGPATPLASVAVQSVDQPSETSQPQNV